MTLEEFRRIQRVNVDGVFLTFRAAARHMAERGHGGSLVATASTAALQGAARNSHYGASKGAVTSMVRACWPSPGRATGSASTASCRAWIVTDMTERSVSNEKFTAAVMPRIPARRWGEIDDFGGIAVYLASDASGYTTGEQFVVDGGYTKSDPRPAPRSRAGPERGAASRASVRPSAASAGEEAASAHSAGVPAPPRACSQAAARASSTGSRRCTARSMARLR